MLIPTLLVMSTPAIANDQKIKCVPEKIHRLLHANRIRLEDSSGALAGIKCSSSCRLMRKARAHIR